MLLVDGAVVTRAQALSLHVEDDFRGRENRTEVLHLSRPDLVRESHRGYFAAGSDILETNIFGGSPITLGKFDLADKGFEINQGCPRACTRGGRAIL